jgi:DNA replication licensing factor MCM2
MKPTGELRLEGEDIMENLDRDYRAIDRLDRYDEDNLSHGEYEEMDFEDRRRADMEIDARRGTQVNPNNIKREKIFDEQSINSFIEDNSEIADDMKKNREMLFLNKLRGQNMEGDDELEQEEYDFFNAEEMKGNLSKWIDNNRTINFIRIAFRTFLTNFRNENKELVYEQRINHMCSNNLQSLEVDFSHLSDAVPVLSFWLFDSPSLLMPYLNQVVFDIARKLFPNYETVHPEVFVKIKNYPLQENIRDLKKEHLNSTVKFDCLVTRRHPVTCQLKKIYYICRCGDRKGPIYQNDDKDISLGACHNCKSNGPYTIDRENVEYRNHQRIIVQEMPSKVPPGRVARQKVVIALGDNIDKVRPGDQVRITGFFLSKFDFTMTSKHGFPIFRTFVEANNIVKLEAIDDMDLIQENLKKDHILELSRHPKVAEIIFQSIAPNIHGHDHVKKAIAMALFGGTPVEQNTHRIRGDINVLMVGDAGMGKSQILKYVQRVVPRTIYTTGKGASAVGLTASVRKDNISREWVLEGGALVLADQGICLIDEFDKMNDNDRTSIHEAMEQQTISISKAGIVATLKARCSVIAAANPINGKYNTSYSFKQNVNLSDPIISRFDVVCVLKDEKSKILDKEMGRFILNNHMNAFNIKELKKKETEEQMEEEEPERIMDQNKENGIKEEHIENKVNKTFEIKDGKISPDFLKIYIAYSRRYINPRMTVKHKKKLQNFYGDLRNKSNQFDGINIVTRHLESLIRMSQASARMHLRNIVENQDIDIAIGVMLTTFIETQKQNIQRQLKKTFKRYLNSRAEYNVLLKSILKSSLEHQQKLKITALRNNTRFEGIFNMSTSYFKSEAAKKGINDISEFLNSKFFKENFLLRNETIYMKE